MAPQYSATQRVSHATIVLVVILRPYSKNRYEFNWLSAEEQANHASSARLGRCDLTEIFKLCAARDLADPSGSKPSSARAAVTAYPESSYN
jgi:hypothetical protein